MDPWDHKSKICSRNNLYDSMKIIKNKGSWEAIRPHFTMVQISARAHSLVRYRGDMQIWPPLRSAGKPDHTHRRAVDVPALLFLMGTLLIRQGWFYCIRCWQLFHHCYQICPNTFLKGKSKHFLMSRCRGAKGQYLLIRRKQFGFKGQPRWPDCSKPQLSPG